jgi:hypothetical protein
MHKIVRQAFLVKTARTIPFTVINAVFGYFRVFHLNKLRYAERSIFIENALILCYGTIRAHKTFPC